MLKLLVTVLLLATILVSAGSIPTGLHSSMEQTGSYQKEIENIRVRRDSDSDGKCTIQEKEGQCVPYFRCDIQSLPANKDWDLGEATVKSLLVCKSAVEVCCPLDGLIKTPEDHST